MLMRPILLAFALTLCTIGTAVAADDKPMSAPTVAELQQQVAYWTAAYQAAAQQRDQAQAALANLQVDAYAKLKSGEPALMPEKK